MKQFSFYAGLLAVAVVLDQWIKYLVETRLPLQETVEVLPFLALYRTYNTGVAFSMLSSFGDTGLIVVSLVLPDTPDTVARSAIWRQRPAGPAATASPCGHPVGRACGMMDGIGCVSPPHGRRGDALREVRHRWLPH